MKEDAVNQGFRVTGRMMWGLVVLTIGVLWTLDNLGQIDASRVLRWWPLVAILWGSLLLMGGTGRRKPVAGWIWIVIGNLSLLRPLGVANVDFSDFWPVIFIVAGALVFWRAWTGRDPGQAGVTTSGSRIDASAYFAGSQRKVVSDAFSTVEINALVAGTTLDLRPARLEGGRGVVDVFALWGGIDLIVPREWRVVSEVTPILGVFADGTVAPAAPDAPTLIVRGSVVMGGIELRNDERPITVRLGPGTVAHMGVTRPKPDTPETP